MMIRSFLSFLIACAFLAGCSNSGKEYFTDKSCDFKILFPSEPSVSDRPITFPFGSFTGKKFSLETTSGLNKSYSVTCIELPANIVHSDSMNLLSQLFALTQMDYLKLFGEGALLNTYIKNINKYPGREFIWGNKSTNTGYTRRVFYVKNKLYLLEVSYPAINQHNMDTKSFLDSFRLLSKDINPHPEPTPKVPGKKFTADFPGKTVTRRQVAQGSVGPCYIVAEMYQPNSGKQPDIHGNLGYGVFFTDFYQEEIVNMSEDLQRKFLYKNAEGNPMIQNGGKIISISESTIDGIWCLETKAVILSGQLEFKSKTFFKDNYLYQVLVLSAPDKGNNSASDRFIESFHVK